MLVAALVLVFAQFGWGAVNTSGGWTVHQLLESKPWKNNKIPLILTKPGSFPDSYVEALVEAINGSIVTHVEVACQETVGDDDILCHSLMDHSLAVRVDGVVEGLDVNCKSEPEFVSVVLELFVSSPIIQLWSYNDLTGLSSLYPHHLLALTPNSEEYATLLSALLIWPIPLGVAMTTGVLPLSQRQQYLPPPSLLQLWYVEEGGYWYSNHDTTGFSLHVIQRCKTYVQLIKEFVERVYYPVMVHYKDDTMLRRKFGDSGLHLVIVFPGLSGANSTDQESLAVSVAQATFMNYAFIIMPDRSRLFRFVMDSKPCPYIILMPYGLKEDLMRWAVEGHDLTSEVQNIIYALRAYVAEKPRSRNGQVYGELGPSFTEVSEIKHKIATRNHHIFAYFCLQGSRQCLQTGYKVVREVLSVVRVSKLGTSLGAHVVVYKSEKVKPFKLKNLITCAMYNYTTKSWTVAKEEILAGFKGLQFIGELTNMSELKEVARVMAHVTLTLADVPPPPKPLHEDDHFSLVAESLPHPTIPNKIQLTSSNFYHHIAKFSKTVIVFCVNWSVRCKVFLHYVAEAHKQLNQDLNTSIAIVGCDNDTELCFQYQVTVYPTVLIFTPSTTNSPTHISGASDSTSLLIVLSQTEKKEDKDGSLAELTPRSLPDLLAGSVGINSTLVLWCDRDASSDTAIAFKHQTDHTLHPNLVFAWINSDEHSRLLSNVVPSATFPSVLALNFKQHSVHLLSVEGNRKTFGSDLTTFLKNLSLGTQDAFGYLADKECLPLQPPISFPSTTHRTHRSLHKSRTGQGPNSSTAHSNEDLPNNHQLHTEL